MITNNLMQVYNLKKKSKWGKKKYKTHSLKEKRTRKFNIGAKACAQRKQEITKSPDLSWDKERDPPRASCYPTKLPTCKRKRPKEFLASQKQQIKAATNVTQGG